MRLNHSNRSRIQVLASLFSVRSNYSSLPHVLPQFLLLDISTKLYIKHYLEEKVNMCISNGKFTWNRNFYINWKENISKFLVIWPIVSEKFYSVKSFQMYKLWNHLIWIENACTVLQNEKSSTWGLVVVVVAVAAVLVMLSSLIVFFDIPHGGSAGKPYLLKIWGEHFDTQIGSAKECKAAYPQKTIFWIRSQWKTGLNL